MKILITGSNGQLAYDIINECRVSGHELSCVDLPELDITDRKNLITFIKKASPDVIINCAGYTAVDDCEKNSEKAFAVNRNGVANIAEAAQQTGSRIVHFSTDFVFDGRKNVPYTEKDNPAPLSVYGKSKLAGEKELSDNCDKFYIFRISWLYGCKGPNFVNSILDVAKKNMERKQPLRVVDDQIGTPTYTADVAKQVMKVIEGGENGIYHSTSEGKASWYDFASLIVKKYNVDVEVVPCSTEEFPRPARRPAFSVLENEKLKIQNMNIMPEWPDAFSDFIKDVKRGGRS